MDDFELELKMGFLDEAAQLLTDSEQSLLVLEQDPENEKIIDQLFRLAHNLKGSSKAVGFPEMGEITHRLESLLLKIKSKEFVVRTDTVNLFLRCLDALQKSVVVFKEDLNGHYDFAALTAEVEAYLASGGGPAPEAMAAPVEEPPPPEPEPETVQAVIQEMPQGLVPEASFGIPTDLPPPDAFDEGPSVPAASEAEHSTHFSEATPPPSVSATPPSTQASGADAFSGLNEVVDQSLAAKNVNNTIPLPTASSQASDAPHASVAPIPSSPKASTPPPPAAAKAPAAPAAGAAAAASADESIRVSLSRIERLVNYVGELVILQTVLREQVSGSNSLLLKKTADQLGKVTKEVQDISMSLRMVPLKQTFQKMQRIVRDTSATLGKKINLVMHGENAELDKTVLEYLGDPLLHLIRNACDHGIESAQARASANKPEVGTIHLSASHQGGNIIIEIQDDGGGIDPENLRRKAISKGLIKESAVLTEKECLQIIFLPGFSTKTEVTDISGRGVGLDVVKNNIAKLQGDVQLTTKLGQGTCFRINLPLTMAIIEAMVIRMGKERFVIPLGHIHESLKPSQKDIHPITGIGEVFTLRGENLPLYRLSRLLGKKGNETPIEDCILIVVRAGSAPFAVLVDDILGQQQVVIKRLGKELQFMSGYTGSAILGDGKPVLILEMLEMLKTYKPEFYALNASATVPNNSSVKRVAA